jgi:hypothetical protein
MKGSNRHSEFVCEQGVEIETYVDGEGPAFVILPSYGRYSGNVLIELDASLRRRSAKASTRSSCSAESWL